jgi:uroporphyrinogen decarboxylase
MNSRERVNRAINFENPDRVPISHAVLPAAQLKYGKKLTAILSEFRDDFGWDFLEDLPVEDYPALYKKGRQKDDFGTVWNVEWNGICGIPVEYPIKELNAFRNYQWPEVFSVGQPTNRQYSGHMVGGEGLWYPRGAWITYFEQMQQLIGMEKFFMDVAIESDNLIPFMDEMLAFNLSWIDKWLELDYDGLQFADDWGGQNSLIISPIAWRRLFKPRYAQMFKKVRDYGKHVWFHSDGYINDIVLDLKEIGVDVINCQISVMGYDWIAQNVRGRLAVRTDIDRQNTLPFGSPREVREEVRRTFEACGSPEGGIVACGEIGPDVPLENIRALYESFIEYGTYD